MALEIVGEFGLPNPHDFIRRWILWVLGLPKDEWVLNDTSAHIRLFSDLALPNQRTSFFHANANITLLNRPNSKQLFVTTSLFRDLLSGASSQKSYLRHCTPLYLTVVFIFTIEFSSLTGVFSCFYFPPLIFVFFALYMSVYPGNAGRNLQE